MSAASLNCRSYFDPSFDMKKKYRRAVIGKSPEVFTDIYLEQINIVVWQRRLSDMLQADVTRFLVSNPSFQISITVTPQNVLSRIRKFLGETSQLDLSKNISQLVGMFCCLFEIESVGLRLAVLDHPMCPKFHVDRVPCRLVTTYHGVATEWLPHHKVNRAKLYGKGDRASDNQVGLYKSQNDIQQLCQGDVALLKGEIWDGNDNAGLVHRSPSLDGDQQLRLLLTIDFGN